MNETAPGQTEPPAKKSFSIFGSIVGIVAFIIAAAIGKTVAQKGVQALFGRSGNAPPVQTFSPSTWSTRTMTDITLDAPFQFGPGPDVTKSLPPQVRQSLDYYEIFDSGDGTNPRATISRIAYKAGVAVSVDGAVDGAMNGAMKPIAAAGGDANPHSTANKTTIDGLSARRASYSGRAGGGAVHLESVFVQNGQKLWQVQVIYTGDSSGPDAARILDSIHIRPAK